MADLLMGGGPPDLSAVGNAASMSKSAGAAPPELQSFTVTRGDDGGVVVSETYGGAPGRRGGANTQDNPFAPDDTAGATSHIGDLLTQMGMAPPPPDESEAPPPPMAAVGPRGAAVRGPRGNVAVAPDEGL